MFSPRWKKVVGDLKGNPTRTLLVVLSIFIGVFAVGMILSSQAILTRELRDTYLATMPAHATISTPGEDSFDDDLVNVIRGIREVEDAEARRSLSMRARLGPHQWQDITLVAIPDYDDMRVNFINPVRGAWPPDEREVLIERSGLGTLQADIGDSVTVELPDGTRRTLPITGVAHDLSRAPTLFTGMVVGFISFDTLEWLGESRDYNEVSILVAGDGTDQAYIQTVANEVYDKIRKSGRDPAFPVVPEPGQHPINFLIDGLVLIMGVLGVLSVFLSGFLVTNTISALLTQQTKYIGIMKSIGARLPQIVAMYLVLVMSFGLIALALAVPLSQLGARAFAGYIAGEFNFDLVNLSVPSNIYLIQAVVSLVVPVVAALIPVFGGSRISIREAISSQSGAGSFGTSMFDRVIQRIRAFPRPVLLSLRNTFRRKGRVALTLMTLTLGGAIFISVFSVQESLRLTVDDVFARLYSFDVGIGFDRPHRLEYLESEALSIPGVAIVESRRQTFTRIRYSDDSESDSMFLEALIPDTATMNPRLSAGRWLSMEDENAVVLSSGVLKNDPDIGVGDDIVLVIKGHETTWRIVGIMPTIGDERNAFVSADYYGRVAREVGTTDALWITTDRRDPALQTQVSQALEEHYRSLGLNVVFNQTGSALSDQINSQFGGIVASLAVMSVLIAIVGGLGLAGTMSLNVLERTREIGVMRAIGASDMSVLQIVLVEGILLGLVSWCLGAALALPISKLLSDAVGLTFFNFALEFRFSVGGLLTWLAISMVLAVVASVLPAWNASRLTVRDVLAYE
ncbi:MAG: FtsX-like permease family protein [Chloroflexaceae bacterium]